MGALCCGEDGCWECLWTPRKQTKYTFTGELLSSTPSLEVRVAIDNASKKRIAVKCFHKRKSTSEELRIARREIRLMQGLSHPRLVQYISHTEDREWVYLAMELCEEGSLEQLIKRRSGDERTVRSAFRGLMEALVYLHERKICHRDIKPENLLFAAGSRPKLADFGLATSFSSGFMRSRLGTPYYLAPEVLSGKYTEKCDIWSAGVVLYYCLRGRRPFTSSIYRDLASEILSGEIADWEGMSSDAVDLVKKMMEKDPIKRLSAKEVLMHAWARRELSVSR